MNIKNSIAACSLNTRISSKKFNKKDTPTLKHTPAYDLAGKENSKGNKIVIIGSDKLQTKENPAASKTDMNEWQELILMAHLSVRTTNVLLSNFSSCDEFLSYNSNSFSALRNCGRKTIGELNEFREKIIAGGHGSNDHKNNFQDRPQLPEDLLKLPPKEEYISLLPIFSSARLINFAWKDLHPKYGGKIFLSDFVFSVRTSKILRSLGMETIGEVMIYPSGNLLGQKNFGRKSLKEVQNIIHSFVVNGEIPLSSSTGLKGGGILPAIDYSSYDNMVNSFVQYCLKTKRNQGIVCNRLNFVNSIPTLEQLGGMYGLTRERVRQILKRANSLLRVKAHRNLLADLWKIIVQITNEGGGIISLLDLAEDLRQNYSWPSAPNPIALSELLSLAEKDKVFSVTGETVRVHCPCLSCEKPMEYLQGLDFKENDSYHLLVVSDKLARQCKSKCHAILRRKFHKAFVEKLVFDSNGKYTLHGDLIYPYKRWLIRHGESLEDLITIVLENHGKPIHFSEIATAIRKENIKYHETSDHNVHSALLRCDTVEIVQRGTYGLKAWGSGGYRSVSTAIENLLDSHDLPMRRSEIINSLNREFSEQNISAALHNWRNRFISIGEGFYDRPEKWDKQSACGLINLLPDFLAKLARFIITNNNCSYKLVLALVFIRGMDRKGAYYLPILKERFFNFYLGRYKKGEIIEADNILVRRIGKIDDGEVMNKAIRRPIERFISSDFWYKKYSSICLHEELVKLLRNPTIRDLMMIVLLKGIDEYYAAIMPSSLGKSQTITKPQMGTKEVCSKVNSLQEEVNSNTAKEDTISITIKKKSRGKIKL